MLLLLTCRMTAALLFCRALFMEVRVVVRVCEMLHVMVRVTLVLLSFADVRVRGVCVEQLSS